MKIFISYAKVNRALIEILVEVLREVGHDPWFDYRLQSGQPWQEQLFAAIKAADLFVYALTPESIASKWCQWEFAEAVHLGKPILPVMTQGKLKLPKTIESQQCADFTEGRTWQATGRLANDLRDARPMAPARVPRLPVPESEPERPTAANVDVLLLPDQLYQEAYAAYRRRDYEDAYDLLVDCLELNPDHPNARGLLHLVEARRATAIPRKLTRLDQPIVPTSTENEHVWDDLLRRFRDTAGFLVPEMVHIPAGPFLMGSDPTRDRAVAQNEQPQITMELPEYYMARYPVTVEEYRFFVEQGGYADRRLWTWDGWAWRKRGERTQPEHWNGEKGTANPRLPVVGISWHEAYAYVSWLNELWMISTESYRDSLESKGFSRPVFCLPTESEWEKAARGWDGRIYPWGDQADSTLCNIEDSGIGQITPVGRFSPGGDSPYGCADMIGNVWEWCRTEAGGQPAGAQFWHYAAGPDSMENGEFRSSWRVLRGGSWSSDAHKARGAYRHRRAPESCEDDFGFRVCLAPPF